MSDKKEIRGKDTQTLLKVFGDWTICGLMCPYNQVKKTRKARDTKSQKETHFLTFRSPSTT